MLARSVSVAWLLAACEFRPTSYSPDARAIDAPIDAKVRNDALPIVFDPNDCPGPYHSITGAGTSSRYRAGPAQTTVTWRTAEMACEADRTPTGAATHLVVFDTGTEHDAVIGALAASINDNFLWTGDYTITGATWLEITGGAMADTRWAAGEPTYKTFGTPMDNPNGAMLQNLITNHGSYQAQPFNYDYNYICECDGKAVAAQP